MKWVAAGMVLAATLAGGPQAPAQQAFAQQEAALTPPQPPADARKRLPPAPGNGTVIKPPANIDPGIKAPVPQAEHFPTPVIRPPAPAAGPKPEQ